jgi:aspartyl aminopeptidase
MDRDLGLSGRVVVKDSEGRAKPMLFRCDEPLARIPNLAIHLNREVNREGLQLNAQKHLPPVVGLGAWGGLASWMARRLEVEAVLSWELGFHEIGASRRGGLDGEFLFAPRLDNLGSCYPAIAALLEVGTSEATQIVALFDHEEIGSRTWRGALSPLLRNLMNLILEQHEDAQPGGLPRAAVHSWMVSSDMTHGVHPNYADRHEPDHKPRMNGGPSIKTHVCGNYATDAASSAFFRLAAEEAGVKVQDFVVKSDLPCGSTIEPLTATELGIRTVDVGNPMLSMHSAREQAGAADVADMVAVMGRCLVR